MCHIFDRDMAPHPINKLNKTFAISNLIRNTLRIFRYKLFYQEPVWLALTDRDTIKKYFFGTEAFSDWKLACTLIFQAGWIQVLENLK